MYVFCGEGIENGEHVFKQSNFARGVWWSNRLDIRFKELEASTFLDLFEKASRTLSVECLEFFVVIAWCLWENRNDVV